MAIKLMLKKITAVVFNRTYERKTDTEDETVKFVLLGTHDDAYGI